MTTAGEFTLMMRADQFDLTVDALEYLKYKIERERKTLGDTRDQSAHFKAGENMERRIDELLGSMLNQVNAQKIP